MEDSQIEELYGVDSNADEHNIPRETLIRDYLMKDFQIEELRAIHRAENGYNILGKTLYQRLS